MGRTHPHAPAIAWEGEEGTTRRVSYRELREASDRLANGLAALGVRSLDAVGIFLPPTPEAVVAVMACSKLGAVWLPLFSGFGADAVAKRLEDAEATVLITADGFPRRGKVVPMKETADEAVAAGGSVRHVIVVDRLGRTDAPWDPRRDIRWDDLLASNADRFETAHLDPEHPLFIAYTSGTTGTPKGAVHVHGGFLVKIAEEVAYQTDVGPGDLLFWFADLGWIMGPWEIVGATALGATVFLYDGAPEPPGTRPALVDGGATPHHAPRGLPHAGARADPARRGAGALPRPFVAADPRLDGRAVEPGARTGGSSRRSAEGRLTDHQPLGRDRGRRVLPVPPPDQPARTLFAAGSGARDGRGRVPPGRDGGGGRRGRRARVPHALAEHDPGAPWRSRALPGRLLAPVPRRVVPRRLGELDEDGQWFLHGRSDDTMNVAGKRLGPAEVESILTLHPNVTESAVVGVPDEVKGEAIWCFVVANGEVPDGLADELSALVAEHLGKAFRPSRVVVVPELPRTRSAKILRRAIRATVVGEDPGDLSSLENPSSLASIRSALG